MAGLPFDPLQVPVQSVSDEPPIDRVRLSAPALRASFQSPAVWQPEQIDEEKFRSASTAPRVAAVLIPIVLRATGPTVLFTERTANLSTHAGQVSFPGGRSEERDADLIATALRETFEEVGIAGHFIEPIGELPDYFTGTGFRVRPVVALVAPGFAVVADPSEVAEVFEVPLEFLMDPSHHQTRRVTLSQGVRTFYAMPYDEHFIWGATAAMVRNLYHFLFAQLSR